MRLFGVAGLIPLLLALVWSASAPASDGVLWRENFDDRAGLEARWGAALRVLAADEGVAGSGCLKFSNPEGERKREDLVSLALPLEQLRGRSLLLSGRLRAEGLTQPDLDYLGPKLMLHIKAPHGELYPDQEKRYGDYGWTEFTVFARIPADASAVTLIVGLQRGTGTLWIDDLALAVFERGRMPEPDLAIIRAPDIYATPRLRGVMSGNSMTEKDIRELAQDWGANLIRYQLVNHGNRYELSDPQAFRSWLEAQLAQMDKVLPLCRKYGIKVVVDLHSGPAPEQGALSSNLLAWDVQSQNLLIEVWRMMARRYKDEPAVWGYDLLNEPREEGYRGEGLEWNPLAGEIARAVREEDSQKPIIIEPARWGSPEGLREFVPVNVPNVIYSVHFYAPHFFTHQGVHNLPSNRPYPGEYEGQRWDKERLRREFAPVMEFQKRYGVEIYIGEFSAARWAPDGSGERWLEDVIDIMEENRWHWSYHAFREWQGWDAEMGSEPEDTTRRADSPRLVLLKRYFARNKAE